MFPKACPKCHGDIHTQFYVKHQVEMLCLQCGRTLPEDQAKALWESRRQSSRAA